MATYEFDQINKHMQNLQELSQEIEKAPNIKSAMDLNSRIEIELADIQVEELRMQTLMNQQKAQQQSTQIAQESEASQFNQAGESQS